MFAQQTREIKPAHLRLAIFMVTIVLLISFTGEASGGGPIPCRSVVHAEEGKKYTQVVDKVICFSIDLSEFSELQEKMLSVEVQAEDDLGEYDLHMEPGPATIDKDMQTFVNKDRIVKDRGLVRFVFNPSTLDFDKEHTFALVPKTDSAYKGKASITFRRVLHPEGVPVVIILNNVPISSGLGPHETAIFPFEVTCPGDIQVRFDLGSGEEKKPFVILYSPDDRVRQTWPKTSQDQSLNFDVYDIDLQIGKFWRLVVNNYGLGVMPVNAEIRAPGDHCPEPKDIVTETFRFNDDHQIVQDVSIAQKFPNANLGSSALCHVDGDEGSGMDRSTLLAWDIRSVPRDSTVQHAVIQIRVASPSVNDFYVYGIGKRWEESEATWKLAQGNVAWERSGAKDPSDRAGYLGKFSGRQSGDRRIVINKELVQSWVKNPATNHGVVITSPMATDRLTFYCSEATKEWHRPMLEITYKRS